MVGLRIYNSGVGRFLPNGCQPQQHIPCVKQRFVHYGWCWSHGGSKSHKFDQHFQSQGFPENRKRKISFMTKIEYEFTLMHLIGRFYAVKIEELGNITSHFPKCYYVEWFLYINTDLTLSKWLWAEKIDFSKFIIKFQKIKKIAFHIDFGR